MSKVGIEAVSVYAPKTYVELADLAAARGVEYAKFRAGLGQEQMAVTPPDEDPVTMAVHAALPLIDADVRRRLQAVIVASESGVDASKAMAVFVHGLLGLPADCLAWDVRQACAGSTAAVIQAQALVQSRPGSAVLVIATDEAVYDLASPGEPTQGAGACAVLVSEQPKLVAFGESWYADTRDVNDFWRPPERRTALVDGRLSVATYLSALKACRAQLPHGPGTWSRALFHLPFTRMAAKAARVLDLPELAWHAGTIYGRQIGNVYTASLYVSLASLLENDEEDLAGSTVGAFAYGSGATGILHELVVSSDYRQHLRTSAHHKMIAERDCISIAEYEAWRALPHGGESVADPGVVSNPPLVRYAGVEGWARQYRFTSSSVEPDLMEDIPKGRASRTSDPREAH